MWGGNQTESKQTRKDTTVEFTFALRVALFGLLLQEGKTFYASPLLLELPRVQKVF